MELFYLVLGFILGSLVSLTSVSYLDTRRKRQRHYTFDSAYLIKVLRDIGNDIHHTKTDNYPKA
jgi:hypothetical protein